MKLVVILVLIGAMAFSGVLYYAWECIEEVLKGKEDEEYEINTESRKDEAV